MSDTASFLASHAWLFYGRGDLQTCTAKGSVLVDTELHSWADTRRSEAHLPTIQNREQEVLGSITKDGGVGLMAEVVEVLNKRDGGFVPTLQGCLSVAVLEGWLGVTATGLPQGALAVVKAIQSAGTFTCPPALSASVHRLASDAGVHMPLLRFLTGIESELVDEKSWWLGVGTLAAAHHMGGFPPLLTDIFMPVWAAHVGGGGAPLPISTAIGALLFQSIAMPTTLPPAIWAGLVRCPDASVASSNSRQRFVCASYKAITEVFDVTSMVGVVCPTAMTSDQMDVFAGSIFPGVLQQVAMEWPWAAYVDRWERYLATAQQYSEMNANLIDQAVTSVCGDCLWAKEALMSSLQLSVGVEGRLDAIRDHHVVLMKTLSTATSYAPRVASALTAALAVLDPKTSSQRLLRDFFRAESDAGAKRQREYSDDEMDESREGSEDSDGPTSALEMRRKRLQSRSPLLKGVGLTVYVNRVWQDIRDTATGDTIPVRLQLRLALPLHAALCDMHTYAIASRTAFEDQHHWLMKMRREQGAKFGLQGAKAGPRGAQRIPASELLGSLEDAKVAPLSNATSVLSTTGPDGTVADHLIRMMWTTACFTSLRRQAIEEEARRRGGVGDVFRRLEEIHAAIDPKTLADGLQECAMRATSTLPITVEVNVNGLITPEEKVVHHRRQAARALISAVLQCTQLHSPDEVATLLIPAIPDDGSPLQQPNPYQGVVGVVLGELLGTNGFQDVPTTKFESTGVSSKRDLPAPFAIDDYVGAGVFAPRRHYHPLSAYAHEEWGSGGKGNAPLMDPKVLTLERYLQDVLVRVFVAQRYSYHVCGTGHDRFLVGTQEILEGLLVYGRCVLNKVAGGTPSPFLCPQNVVIGARGHVVRDVVQKVTDALCGCLDGCARRGVLLPGGLKREIKDWVRYVVSIGLSPRGLDALQTVM